MKSAFEPSGTRARGAGGQWPRAVLFDLDGTLVDTGPDIAAAVNRMLEDLGLASHPTERILDWMGDGAPRLVQRALVGGEEGEPQAEEMERGIALFHRHYGERICVHSRPYPHVRGVLDLLRQARIGTGCVTNKPEHPTRRLLEALDLSSSFDVVVGGDTLANKKPSPEPIRHACRQLDLCPEDAVYVGDSPTDCQAARAAGVTMVLVTYGYHRGADLTKAPCDAMISSLDALNETLERI